MHQDLQQLMSRMASLNEQYSWAIAGLSTPRRSTGRENYGRTTFGRTSSRAEYTRDQESVREQESKSNGIREEIIQTDAALQEMLDRLYPNIQDLIDEVYAPLRARADEYHVRHRPELSIQDFENPPRWLQPLGVTYTKLKYLLDTAREEQLTLDEKIQNCSLKEYPNDKLTKVKTQSIIDAIVREKGVSSRAPLSSVSPTFQALQGLTRHFKASQQEEGTWMGTVKKVDHVELEGEGRTAYSAFKLIIETNDGRLIEGAYMKKIGGLMQRDVSIYPPDVNDIVIIQNIGKPFEHNQTCGWPKKVQCLGSVELVLPHEFANQETLEVVRIQEIGRAVLRGDCPFRDYIVTDLQGNRSARTIDGINQPRTISLQGEARPSFSVGDIMINDRIIPSYMGLIKDLFKNHSLEESEKPAPSS